MSGFSLAFGTTALEVGLANGGIDGIGCYTLELGRLVSEMSEVDFHPYAHNRGRVPTSKREEVFGQPAVSAGSYLPQAAFSLLTGADFLALKKIKSSCPIDLIHATDHLVPRVKRTPVLATLMDVIPLSNPEWVDYRFKWLMSEAWRLSFKWASRIVTISQYSKQQIVRYIGVDEAQVDVVHLGINERWFINPSVEDKLNVVMKYDLPHQYFLFVGTLQPRKNLRRLMSAHKRLPHDVRSSFPLVIVGRYGWGDPGLLNLLRSNKDPHIRWLKYVESSDLPAVVSGARALVFPSLSEGFGLPIVESFAMGTPVAASNITSIPEVADGAALLFDPYSLDDLRRSLFNIATNDDLVSRLSIKGRVRAQSFSWEETAKQTAIVYKKTMGI